MPKVLLLLLLLNLSAFAQDTWGGLRFGMSEDEVRKAHQGSLRKMSEGEVSDMYTERYQEEAKSKYILEDANQTLEKTPAQLRLIFSKDQRTLLEVNVTAKGNSPTVIYLLNRDLIEKYGRPVTEEGECNATLSSGPGRTFSCLRTWKSEGQIVKIHWYFLEGRASVFLTYALPPKGI
jgi:hypothetical protein